MFDTLSLTWEFRDDLLLGLRNTLLATAACMVSSVVFGLLLGVASTSHLKLLRGTIAIYVDVFRSIPLLVLLWLVYFGLPTLPGYPILVTPAAAVFIAFTLSYTTYQTEIFRAGIKAIDTGQLEAARSLGMRPAQVFRRIVMRQIVRIVLPPTMNQFTDILKSTAMAGTVAFAELFRTAQLIGTMTYDFMSAFLVVSVIYAVICLPLVYLTNYFDKRLRRGTAY